ncbi:alpha/beta hydrolase [Leuconostoc rapi]|uniref:alpha/beta hydrolase n=1 Tax=Leuconostoc rapi TaxID=1406906 RepID=UPI001957235B|nr:alpha/beta hydrolase [Leuconostoc rapi]MBM7436182.1 putative alpha/beta hydrolase family protein [Leuconostoc rapi]
MTKYKKILIPIAFVLMIFLIGYVHSYKGVTQSTGHATRSTITPTLFFHGYGSSYKAEQQMTHYLVEKGDSNTIIRSNVSNQGKVKLSGVIDKKAKNPLVEVNYENNRNTNYYQDGQWMKNVIVALQKKYEIKEFNAVGHSMGNMSIVFYVLDHSSNDKLPKLAKQVNIAGHFNGILRMDDKANQMVLDSQGKPQKMNATYQELLKLRTSYPNNQVSVLNIFGDKNDGSHSDGSVSNASSQSLRYLISDRTKSYKELKITGKDAQHSKLHENTVVDQALNHFLFE